MIWLAEEIWLWMVLAALAGAVLTGFFATKEIKLERWVASPVPESEREVEVDLPSTATSAAPRHEEPASPFPELQPVSGPRPWEDEELWSRPAAPATAPATALAARSDLEGSSTSWQGWAGETAAASAPQPLEPVTEPVAELSAEPVAQPVAQPVAEPVAEPVAALAPAPDPFPMPFTKRCREADAPPVVAESVAPVVVVPVVEPVVTSELEIIPGLLEVVEIVEPEDQVEAVELEPVELEPVAAEVVEAEMVEAAVEADVIEPVVAVTVPETAAQRDADPEPEPEPESESVVPDAEPELSAAEKIRAELARLEAELAKREARKQELLEAERLEHERQTPEPVRAQQDDQQDDQREDLDAQREAERLEVERLEAERAARARARAEKAAATRARKKAEREQAEQAEKARLEAEAAERAAAEQAAAEKAAAKRAAAAAARTAREEAKRLEAKREAELRAAEEAAAELHEAARIEAAESRRARASRAKAARESAERLEAELAETHAEVVPLGRAKADPRQRLEEDLVPVEAPINLASWIAPSEDNDDWKHGPFGPGSAHPVFDGSAPRGFPVKANTATKLYHSPRSRFYSRTQADAWFETEEHAEAAGFTRWDRRSSTAHLALDLGRDQAAQG